MVQGQRKGSLSMTSSYRTVIPIDLRSETMWEKKSENTLSGANKTVARRKKMDLT